MQFLNRRASAAYLAIIFLVALMSGCGGGGSSDKAAATVTGVNIFPSSISLEPGQVTQVFAQAVNSNGGQVFSQTITFTSSNSQIDITPTGSLCAGKWDSLTAPVVCTPATTVPTTTNVVAAAAGVSSPTTVVYIHQPVNNVKVSASGTPSPGCVPEGGTQVFKAQAFDASNNDITASVGTFSWTSSQTQVATVPSTGDTGFNDQATATAVHPGVSNINAFIGTVTGTNGTAAVFTQCLVNSIAVSVGTPSSTTTPIEDATHFTVNTGASRALLVTVKDTTGATLTTVPSLIWNTTHPAIATVAGTGTGANVAGVAAGAVGISASCLPNNCNIGTTNNVTSNLVSGTVNGTASTSATAYVTCSTVAAAPNTCNTGTDAAPQVKLFPISDTTLGTSITLSHVPNSMVINPQNSRIYLGSTPTPADTGAGLMVVDANANTFTGTVPGAPGKILAVAPNGNAVVTSNGADVFLYNGTSAAALLLAASTHITNATAAAFSPDSGKLIIGTSGGKAIFEVPGATPTAQTGFGTLVSAAFYPSGSLQGVSTSAATHVFGTDATNTLAGTPACGGTIQPVPNADGLYAADPAGTVCVIDNTPAANAFSIGAFGGNSVLIDPTGTLAYLVGNSNIVKINTIGSATVTPITLSSGDTGTTGGIATNGTVYVGAVNGSTNSVHVISAGLAGTDSGTPIATTIPADLVVAKH